MAENKLQKKLLSFKEDNLDVYKLLKEQDDASDYVCKAVRFHEKYKDNTVDAENISRMFNQIETKLENVQRDIKNLTIKNDQCSPETIHTTIQHVDKDLEAIILSEED